MKQPYEEYLRTDEWRAIAQEVKRRAGHRCQVCNSPDDVCAHHRTYEHIGNEAAHLGDLTCLCRVCHELLKKGWEKRLVGKAITTANYKAACIGADKKYHAQNRR